MKCKQCGHELPKSAKVCSYCGSNPLIDDNETVDQPTVDETVQTESTVDIKEETIEEEASINLEDLMPDLKQTLEDKVWFYAIQGDSYGPFTRTDMNHFLEDGTLTEMSYVWTKGMKEWELWKNSPLATLNKIEPQLVQESWFFVDNNNEQNGPFETYMMVDMIKKGSLTPNTYVWKTGMGDWIHLKDTELNAHITNRPVSSIQPGINQQTPVYSTRIRDIAPAIILTLVTCGLYGLYWIYTMANDSNEIFRANNMKEGPSAGVVLLLSIITCGIYTFVFYWQVSKQLSEVPTKGNYLVQDNSVISLVLALIGLSIVSMAIIQDEMNGIIKNAQG